MREQRRSARSPIASCLTSTIAACAFLSAGELRADDPDYAGMLLTNQSLLNSPPSSCDIKTARLTSFELQQCSAVAFREADRAMNQAYRAALKDGNAGRNAKLQQAQRHWLAFRNLECAWQSLQFEGGTFAPVAMGNCLVDVTRARVQQLQDGNEH